MNTEDMAILDRIERLAFQAGVASRNELKPEPKEELKPEAKVVLSKVVQIGKDYPTFVGTALSGIGTDSSHVLTWEEVIALSKVM